ncbi:hypothetical protein [Actinomadura kijaniata]|uniref:hypothetical protein n=1 Tax=Actinomadura kijaniata TaxID=46161 RepID=UPI00082A96C2|nr:hypothetical protein [Actinomadura kijaniata]
MRRAGGARRRGLAGPARTWTVLLVAAVADTGTLPMVLDTAARLDGERLTFRRPLIQSTVYQ